MNGPRLKPIESSRLYNKIVNYIKNRRQRPTLKAYKTKSFGIKHQIVFDDAQKWCKEFPIFIQDEDDEEIAELSSAWAMLKSIQVKFSY